MKRALALTLLALPLFAQIPYTEKPTYARSHDFDLQHVKLELPAAGLGTRMAPMPSALDAKTKKPHPSKQFTELAGTPILIHTLRKFAAVDAVSEIWIALRENE